jgi:HK97 family phage major capsid protein
VNFRVFYISTKEGEINTMSEELKKLLAQLSGLETQSKALIAKEDATAEDINAKLNEIKAMKAKIEAQKQIDEMAAEAAKAEAESKKPVNEPLYAEPKDHTKKMWKNNGEFLKAVYDAAKPGGNIDPRLTYRDSSSGMSEQVPSDGGFLVGQDFAEQLLQKTYDTGLLAPKCTKIPISPGKNGLVANGVDETSRKDGSRWGGIQAYWENEADVFTGKKPKFNKIELKLKKLTGLCYATDELLEDATALEAVISQAFAEEFGFKMDDAIMNGEGVGMPLGFLNSGALVTVPKETGQASGSILLNNIVKMYSHMWSRSKQNALWLINQDIIPQLYTLNISVGNNAFPVYMPPGGVSGEPYGTLFGRPVMEVEQVNTLGSVGDISFADLSQYLLIDKGGINAATSIHVRFLYDESVFRFIYRVDGQPIWKTSLTPYKGANTLSPFITLGARN